MSKTFFRSLVSLSVAALLLLSACAPVPNADPRKDSSALTLNNWTGYDAFLELLKETYPDIEIERTAYAGGNRTGYSWAQMRAGDIPDIFVTSQILDREVAKRELVDLSGYDFISGLPTSVLDHVSIDGGVYLLPIDYAMYGILYNKTLMEEHDWELPTNFAELEALCKEIKAAGLIPGVMGLQLTGNAFSAVFNLAKTDWFTTPEGVVWERDFLAGDATAAGAWEGTMEYVQRYIDIGMLQPDPEDRSNPSVMLDYMSNRKAVFYTAAHIIDITEIPETGDKLGLMPYISQDGSKNIYMYSPTCYIGLSKRLTEPGNEQKLKQAINVFSLLYSPEGQAAFVTEKTPSLLSALNNAALPEDALIYDAQQALREGRAFPMTYAGWDSVLSDIGQAFKEWIRGDNNMDGPKCIARMDELQQGFLNHSEQLYFCESTADFTLEETAGLLGKALGSAAGADAAMIPVGTYYREGDGLKACATGRLYEGKINSDVASTLVPAFDKGYALLTMTGAQAKELAKLGFDSAGDGRPFPYVLTVKGGGELADGQTYQIAFIQQSYTPDVGAAYQAHEETGSLRTYLREWLEAEGTVSPDGNPWN